MAKRPNPNEPWREPRALWDFSGCAPWRRSPKRPPALRASVPQPRGIGGCCFPADFMRPTVTPRWRDDEAGCSTLGEQITDRVWSGGPRSVRLVPVQPGRWVPFAGDAEPSCAPGRHERRTTVVDALSANPIAAVPLVGVVLVALVSGARAGPVQQAPSRPAQPSEVSLFVREDQGVDRTDEPVASGVPLPRGAVLDPSHLRVYDQAGRAVPCQCHQLGLCWPDGSLRWVLLQFQATVKGNSTATYTLRADPSSPAPTAARRVEVAEAADSVAVNTGLIRFTVSRADFRLPDLLRVDGNQSPAVGNCRLQLIADREHMTLDEFRATGREAKPFSGSVKTDLSDFGIADTGTVKWGKVRRAVDYSSFLAGPVDITVEESGPLRAVLRIEGAAEKKEGEVGFVARLHAYAGKRRLRVELTLESYEQFIPVPVAKGYAPAIVNSKHIRELTCRFGVPEAADTVEFGGTTDAPLRVEAARSPSLRQPDPDAFSVGSGGGEVLHKGGRAAGWMTVTRGARSVSVATKWFWESAPRALGYDAAAKELVLELRPETATGYPIPAGRIKTYEFLIGVDTPGPQLSAMARGELRAYPDPEYVTATGATHRFVPATDKRFSRFGDYIRRTREKAAAVRLFGDIDFGDQIGWNADARWNGYHGATHEWFMFYLATGDPELFRVAEQETWHSIDVDTQHWGYARGCREAEYARKFDHVCASPIQGGIKVWSFGEVDYYFLTGSRRVLESLGRTADFLLRCGGVANRSYHPERATSLPFLHLAYMYEALGDEAPLATLFPGAMKAGAGQFRKDSLGPEWSKPHLTVMKEMSDYFNGVYDRGEHMWCSFLASYPAEALHRFYSLTGDKTAAEGVVKAARFMYNDMIVPTGTPKYAGGAPWGDLDKWMPWWDGVEAPAALAYQVSGDRTFLVWGLPPVDWLLNYRGYGYSSGPWSWQGALGFGGTLSTFLWTMREAGMTQDDLGTLRPDLDYEQALKACRDECMKHYDRAMQNTAESSRFCRLAAEIGRVLINQKRYGEAVDWLEKWKTAPYAVYVKWVLKRAEALKAASQAP